MRRHLASLTSRLVLTTVALVLAVCVLIGVATTFAMQSYLTGQLDHQVHQSLNRTVDAYVRGRPDAGLGAEAGMVTVEVPDGGAANGRIVSPRSTAAVYRRNASAGVVSSSLSFENVS